MSKTYKKELKDKIFKSQTGDISYKDLAKQLKKEREIYLQDDSFHYQCWWSSQGGWYYEIHDLSKLEKDRDEEYNTDEVESLDGGLCTGKPIYAIDMMLN